ncbi:hypothetical protein A3I48_01670, partial [Candidatus Daviesbacteria bacterium RIFCSPLOWO2_02_FULL_36_7]
MAKLIDTNLIIRFLLKDNLTQAEAAKTILTQSDEDLILPDIAVAEVVWVLQSVYEFKKQEVIEKIFELLKLSSLIINSSLLTNSLVIYQNHHISFVDAYLMAYCEYYKLAGIYSFDKGLDKVK